MRALYGILLFVAGCFGATSRGDGGTHGDSAGFNFDFGGVVCSPSDPPGCDGTSVKMCRADGSGYDYTACSVGCAAGVCTCTPGDVSCAGPDVMKCGVDGAFHLDHTCPVGSQCANGLCSDARCDDEVMSTNPHALPTDGWPRFRHDNRNTGASPAKVAALPKFKWRKFVGGTNLNNQVGLASGPVVNQMNQIFIGAGDLDNMGGAYYSFDPNGKPLFTFPASRGYGLSTPAVRADATSYFSTTNMVLYAVDPVGMKVWQFGTPAQADSDPIVTKEGTLIYSSDDGSLYALDFAGKPLWTSDPLKGPGEVDGGLAESCDGKIYAGGKNGWFQLDAKTGNTNWMVASTGGTHSILSSPLVTADGTMYGVDSGGQGVAVSAAGKPLWQKPVGPAGAGSSLGKIGNLLFVVLNDGALHAIDAGTGVEKWSRPVGNNPHFYLNAGPVTDGNQLIYFNSSDGFVYAFDTAGTQKWRIAASGQAQTMCWSGTIAIGRDGTLYVPGNDGFLYAFQ